MLQQNIFLFALIIRIARSLQSVLLEWSPTTRKLTLSPNFHVKHRKLNQKLVVHACMLTLIGVQGIFIIGQDSSYTFTDKFVYWFGFLYIFSSHFQLQVCRRQADTLCLYVNGILEFKDHYRRTTNGFGTFTTRQPPLIEKLNVYFAKAFCMSVLTLPISFLYGLHWINPCKPSLAGFWILPVCGSLIWEPGMLELPVKMVIFLVNHWTWSFTLNVSLFVVSGIQVLSTLSLRGYIERFERISSLPTEHAYNTGVIYRNIQLLASLANQLQKRVFMSVLVIAATILISLCTTAVLKLPWSPLAGNIVSILMFGIIGVDCAMAVVITVGGMAGVYTESERVISKLRKSHGILGGRCGGLEGRWKQRFYRSCPLIKIKFGSINFVDRFTPLNCVNFANELTLQLLLLSK